MKPFREVLERYDNLWEYAENAIEAYLSRRRGADAQPSGEHPPNAGAPTATTELPDLKELNVAITILKRIQDARRAIHLDALKWEATPANGGKTDSVDNEEVSRILQLLQNGENPPGPDEETV